MGSLIQSKINTLPLTSVPCFYTAFLYSHCPITNHRPVSLAYASFSLISYFSACSILHITNHYLVCVLLYFEFFYRNNSYTRFKSYRFFSRIFPSFSCSSFNNSFMFLSIYNFSKIYCSFLMINRCFGNCFRIINISFIFYCCDNKALAFRVTCRSSSVVSSYIVFSDSMRWIISWLRFFLN
jgi:hypothetical protein